VTLAAVLMLLLACTEKTAPAAAAGGVPAKVETAEYVVSLVDAKATGGAVIITAKPPLHVNPDYPTAFKPDPGGAKFEGERVALTADTRKPCEKADETCELHAPLAWSASAGQLVSGTLLFSVCEPQKCLIEKVRLGATLP
jgi:hypothetical protein